MSGEKGREREEKMEGWNTKERGIEGINGMIGMTGEKRYKVIDKKRRQGERESSQ